MLGTVSIDGCIRCVSLATDSSPLMTLPENWTVGRLVYDRVNQGGQSYAVLHGQPLEDSRNAFLVKLDPKSQLPYFVNVSSRTKSWELPPLGSTTLSFRDRVVRLYETYNKSKLDNVDVALKMYQNKEDQLIIDLTTKYGPEPAYPVEGATVTASPSRSVKDRVYAMYQHYNPTKIALADGQLMKYAGQEEALIEALVNRYGPEPPPTPAPAVALGPASAVPPPSAAPPPAAATSQPAASIPQPAAVSQPIPVADPSSDFLRRVTAIFFAYKPEKVDSAAKLLEKNRGNEEGVIAALVSRYGPEPTGNGQLAATQPAAASPTPAPSPPPAVPPTTSSFKERVIAIFNAHAPAKVGTTDSLLQKYAGNEEGLIEALVSKYGPEPVATQNLQAVIPSPQTPQMAQGVGASPSATAAPPTSDPGTETASQPRSTTPAAPDDSSQKASSTAVTAPSVVAVPTAPVAAVPTAPTIATQSIEQHTLLTFLTDREERLRDATRRFETCTATIEALTNANAKLSEQIESTKCRYEDQIRDLELRLCDTKLSIEADRTNWRLEKERLSASAELSAVTAARELNAQRLDHERSVVSQMKEISDLKAKLSQVSFEADSSRQRASTLLEAMEKKDNEIRQLHRRIRDMEARLDMPMASCATQTIEDAEGPRQATQVVSSDSLETDAVVAKFDRAVAEERETQTQLERTMDTVKCLEAQLEAYRSGVLQQLAVSHDEKGKKMISDLQARNRWLTDRVAHLEMCLLARPGATPEHLSPPKSQSTPAKKASLDHLPAEVPADKMEVRRLRQELDSATKSCRQQNREISDLRSLLAIHMSARGTTSATPGSGAARGKNERSK